MPASPTRCVALRNGTIGWTLAKQTLEHGSHRRGEIGAFAGAEANARDVAYRAGVRRLDGDELAALGAQTGRTLYRFDVRDAEEYAAGHITGFRHYAGGQLVQEIDMAAPVRGARIVLTDDRSVRADMTASWLAQMGWETYVLDGGYDGALEATPPLAWPKPDPAHRYRRPYEGTNVDTGAMQAYLDWEYGLVEQFKTRPDPWFFRYLKFLRCLTAAAYIGGVRPSLPNSTAPLCSEPSSCFCVGTNTMAPGLISALSAPGTSVTTGTLAGTSIFFSPPL